VAQLGLKQSRRNTVGSFTFQAAAPDREAVGHLGSPFGRAEQMPSRPKVCTDAAEGGQEPSISSDTKRAADYCGDWWLATSKRYVTFESWYERDHLIALDFDPGVVAVAATKGSHSRRSVTARCADSGVMSRGMVAEFRRASSDDAITEPVCRARDAACQVGMCERQ
jgi:hypothetical protein